MELSHKCIFWAKVLNSCSSEQLSISNVTWFQLSMGRKSWLFRTCFRKCSWCRKHELNTDSISSQSNTWIWVKWRKRRRSRKYTKAIVQRRMGLAFVIKGKISLPQSKMHHKLMSTQTKIRLFSKFDLLEYFWKAPWVPWILQNPCIQQPFRWWR